MPSKIEHVIGRDGLHRIRKTDTGNHEKHDNSHEGFSSKDAAFDNEVLNFEESLLFLGTAPRIAEASRREYRVRLLGIPTLDERDPDREAIQNLTFAVRDPQEPQQ